MKISNLNINRVKSLKSDVQPAQKATAGRKSTQDLVSISEDARFLSDLREAATRLEEIRPDVVEQARADIEQGLLGTDEDYDRAIEALLMEL